MKWFRFYVDIIDDPKMVALKDDEYRAFTYLMALASELENEGKINLTIEEISWRLRSPAELIDRTIKRLKALKVLKNSENFFVFINWKKRQFKSDSSKTRTRKYRENKGKDVTSQQPSPKRHSDALEQNRTEQSINSHFSNTVGVFLEAIEKHGRAIDFLKIPKFNVWALIQEWANKKIHPGAIAEVLEGVVKYLPKAQNPQAYCRGIMKTKSQNWNEKEFAKEVEMDKAEWDEFFSLMKKGK